MPTTIPTPTGHDDGADAVIARLRAARPASAQDAEEYLALYGQDVLAGIIATPRAATTTTTSDQSAAPAPASGHGTTTRSSGAVISLRRPVSRRRRVRRSLLAAAAVAAIALPGAYAVQHGLPAPFGAQTNEQPGQMGRLLAITGDDRAAASASAGSVLIELASMALREPVTPGSATVSYVEETSAARVGDLSALTTSTTQTWKAPDGSGRQVTGSGSTTDPLAEADDSWGPGQSPESASEN